MKQAMNWFEHLQASAEQSRDLTVYGKSWAHDVRCLRTDMTHRRVGLASAGHDEWLQAGFVTRTATSQVG